MSVQIQVLITALVETLKTHVLSVLILLFLLMYITSIIAFYFFSPNPKLRTPWGNILTGMLRLFSFVTVQNKILDGNARNFVLFVFF
jgi:cation channel sperm-associated protein 3